MMGRWPEMLQPGSICQVPVTGVDVFPTVCALTGSQPPEGMTLDGVDLSPLFISGATSHTGDTASPTSDALSLRNLYWHFPFYHPDFVDTRPQSAIRAGKYKLIYQDRKSTRLNSSH